jgi:hypothetical protein
MIGVIATSLQPDQILFWLQEKSPLGRNSTGMGGDLHGSPVLHPTFWEFWERDVPLVVCRLSWFFCLLGGGSFHFVPCIRPLIFGVFISLAGFHQLAVLSLLAGLEVGPIGH